MERFETRVIKSIRDRTWFSMNLYFIRASRQVGFDVEMSDWRETVRLTAKKAWPDRMNRNGQPKSNNGFESPRVGLERMPRILTVQGTSKCFHIFP